jgi:hypothetical protein
MVLKLYSFAAAVALCITTLPANAQTGNPAVFGSHAELRKTGIELVGWGPAGGRELPEKCGGRYGGDGAYNFSFSRDFVAKFKKRGFTNLSLCMAMESEIKYDPETGARLPTFVLADIPAVRRGLVEAGTATDEIPFTVPDCFKNARPLHDCKLNFDMKSGRRLTTQQTRKLRQAGVNGTSPVALTISNRQLPKGQGYVLYNEGPAGPEPSNETLKIVLKKIGR